METGFLKKSGKPLGGGGQMTQKNLKKTKTKTPHLETESKNKPRSLSSNSQSHSYLNQIKENIMRFIFLR